MSSGKQYVGGAFTVSSSTPQNFNNKLTRLNTDGSADTGYNVGASGFNNNVSSIAIQSDGKAIVGGAFTTYQGLSQGRIIRLNTDASWDTTFSTGVGFSASPNAIAIQSDGKIVVGGNFTSYLGIARNYIIRLLATGGIDTTFSIGTGFGTFVRALAIQSDGKILVGGDFTTYQGTNRNRIARLNTDGSFDTTFSMGTGFNGAVRAIYIQSDGKIIVGGDFTTYQGTTSNRIIRLNTDGSIDATFNVGTGFINSVRGIAIQTDGKVVAVGDSASYQGNTSNYIVRINTNGSFDSTFNTGTGFGSPAYSIALQSDGKIVVGGNFLTYQGNSSNKIIRLNTDGSIDTPFSIGSGFNGIAVQAVAIQSDGEILVGGDFTWYQIVTMNRLMRLNTDGSFDSTFNIGTGFNNIVRAIAIQPDGKILVGGDFATYQGITSNRIVRLNTDGSIDSTFNIGSAFGGNTVRAIAIQSDGKIVVGGNFTSYQGITSNRIIRLNTDGSIDATFNIGTGFNNTVRAIAIQPDGKILVGGDFATYQGVFRSSIARLNSDGSIDQYRIINTGSVNCIQLIP